MSGVPMLLIRLLVLEALSSYSIIDRGCVKAVKRVQHSEMRRRLEYKEHALWNACNEHIGRSINNDIKWAKTGVWIWIWLKRVILLL